MEILLLSPLPPEPHDRGATIDIPLHNGKDLKAKERELQAKEAELKKREEALKQKEDAIAREKNWPPCFPITHHDIAAEIPLHLQKMQYFAFTTLLGLVGCLSWNIVATTVAWIKGEGSTIWLLSIIYFYCRGSWSLCFMVSSIIPCNEVHIGFCVFATVAPPIIFKGKSLAGILPALDIATSNTFVGVFYFIGFGCFAVESLLSIWVIQDVYMYFRGSGKAAEMRRQSMMAAL